MGFKEAVCRSLGRGLSVEMQMETYLQRLSPADQLNVAAIRKVVACNFSPSKGVLIAVGSSIRRTDNFADIDLVVLRENGVPAYEVNKIVVHAIKDLEIFDVNAGWVLGSKGERKPCLYLKPHDGGKTIHLILSYFTDCIPKDDFFERYFSRAAYSRICNI